MKNGPGKSFPVSSVSFIIKHIDEHISISLFTYHWLSIFLSVCPIRQIHAFCCLLLPRSILSLDSRCVTIKRSIDSYLHPTTHPKLVSPSLSNCHLHSYPKSKFCGLHNASESAFMCQHRPRPHTTVGSSIQVNICLVHSPITASRHQCYISSIHLDVVARYLQLP